LVLNVIEESQQALAGENTARGKGTQLRKIDLQKEVERLRPRRCLGWGGAEQID
jgi:hypothetical protein